ncbi:hypothetical protein PGTUg99_034946 [Puccinia graminis f. sp. tritici]|uniref:Uncharacterized protein n=1 Tax=Puccinia graminis f. sp. tritici TaxID=56615 RepID=A0A5B0S1L0_PUCGR|nr:hypothetical protein PGTUg99_034946 [Puccinia graminis f. sp. tritici]
MNAGEALRPRDRGMGSAVIPGCCCHPARLLDIDLWLFHEVILIVIWTCLATHRSLSRLFDLSSLQSKLPQASSTLTTANRPTTTILPSYPILPSLLRFPL